MGENPTELYAISGFPFAAKLRIIQQFVIIKARSFSAVIHEPEIDPSSSAVNSHMGFQIEKFGTRLAALIAIVIFLYIRMDLVDFGHHGKF